MVPHKTYIKTTFCSILYMPPQAPWGTLPNERLAEACRPSFRATNGEGAGRCISSKGGKTFCASSAPASDRVSRPGAVVRDWLPAGRAVRPGHACSVPRPCGRRTSPPCADRKCLPEKTGTGLRSFPHYVEIKTRPTVSWARLREERLPLRCWISTGGSPRFLHHHRPQ